jgi:hypothetical protein
MNVAERILEARKRLMERGLAPDRVDLTGKDRAALFPGGQIFGLDIQMARSSAVFAGDVCQALP